MPEASNPTHWTYADRLLLPDDGRIYEILEGELIVSPFPVPRHQIVTGNLFFALRRFVDERNLGTCLFAPLDVVLAEDIVVEPDILFIRREREGIIGPKYVTAAPDLVIEVLSESSRRVDPGKKKRAYAAHGVEEYWIVDPDAELVDVFVLSGPELVHHARCTDGDLESPRALSGFRMPLAGAFR